MLLNYFVKFKCHFDSNLFYRPLEQGGHETIFLSNMTAHTQTQNQVSFKLKHSKCILSYPVSQQNNLEERERGEKEKNHTNPQNTQLQVLTLYWRAHKKSVSMATTDTQAKNRSQNKNPLVLAAPVHSKVLERVRQPNMCLLFSPSASIDSDHIHELCSQGLGVGFCFFKERLPELQEQKS